MAKKGKGINIFRNVPKANPNRTAFPMYHECTFDGDFGIAYPVFCQEVVPGDTWHISADHFSRLAPMPAPVMHKFDVRFHWFFVPMRLLWDDFEDWMTGGRTGTWREENPDALPLFRLRSFVNKPSDLIGTLFDFLGVNTKFDGVAGGDDSVISSGCLLPHMPVRGYVLIFNYFFRDQNVQEEIPIPLTSGLDDEANNLMLSLFESNKFMFKVAWDKDYFTSASLSPQRGPQVYVPIGGAAPLNITSATGNVVVGGNGSSSIRDVTIYNPDGYGQPTTEQIQVDDCIWASGNTQGRGYLTAGAEGLHMEIKGTVSQMNIQGTADLANATGAAVDDVREAFALQRFFERMQVVGSRFAEFLRGIWGTEAGDARLQMPEYLGTWTNPFMINNVSNTTGTAENPQGGYAGNGMSSQRNQAIHKNFPEHGYLYCLYVAMPRNGYQQGLAPIFCRRDWLDFCNPYFEHIGEQPIKVQELYFDPTGSMATNDEIFGYQSQYANYKFIASHSHGQMKSTLNFWHANRIFSNVPRLSETFIKFNGDESTDRDFHLMDESKFYTQITFDGYVERNLSAFSTPKLI